MVSQGSDGLVGIASVAVGEKVEQGLAVHHLQVVAHRQPERPVTLAGAEAKCAQMEYRLQVELVLRAGHGGQLVQVEVIAPVAALAHHLPDREGGIATHVKGIECGQAEIPPVPFREKGGVVFGVEEGQSAAEAEGRILRKRHRGDARKEHKGEDGLFHGYGQFRFSGMEGQNPSSRFNRTRAPSPSSI